jgi:hypothetical protein
MNVIGRPIAASRRCPRSTSAVARAARSMASGTTIVRVSGIASSMTGNALGRDAGELPRRVVLIAVRRFVFPRSLAAPARRAQVDYSRRVIDSSASLRPARSAETVRNRGRRIGNSDPTFSALQSTSAQLYCAAHTADLPSGAEQLSLQNSPNALLLRSEDDRDAPVPSALRIGGRGRHGCPFLTKAN